MDYIVNPLTRLDGGFNVTGRAVEKAITQTNTALVGLPAGLYKSIDYKTTSSIIGALYCEALAKLVGAIVNPIEKGHPDIIPLAGKDCSEEELRNYPQGLEVKCTIGNLMTGANLRAGETRIQSLTGITWQAHHRDVNNLLGLVWDFVASGRDFYFPTITAAFYAATLQPDDWGEISGTTGRNTKVTGLKISGKAKMGAGWVALFNRPEYLKAYSRFLKFDAALPERLK